jgi:hypothetical protein
MPAGQQRGDCRRLAVAAHRQDYAVVAPLHTAAILLIAHWRGKCARFMQGGLSAKARCTAFARNPFVRNDSRGEDFAAQLARLLRSEAVLG